MQQSNRDIRGMLLMNDKDSQILMSKVSIVYPIIQDHLISRKFNKEKEKSFN